MFLDGNTPPTGDHPRWDKLIYATYGASWRRLAQERLYWNRGEDAYVTQHAASLLPPRKRGTRIVEEAPLAILNARIGPAPLYDEW